MPGDLRGGPVALARVRPVRAPWHRHRQRLGLVRLRHPYSLAGLQSIPPEYGEAAAIDGASRWRVVRDITLPLLAPRLLFVTATSVAALLTSFVVPYVMTNGGPGTATRVLPLLIYQTGFEFLRAGQASAMAFILLLITLVFTAFQFRLFGREVL